MKSGYLPIHYHEQFDDHLPDWTQIESEEDADAGVESRKQILLW